MFAIRRATERALAHIRGTGQPAFLECLTYRWKEHVGPGEDYDAGLSQPRRLATLAGARPGPAWSASALPPTSVSGSRARSNSGSRTPSRSPRPAPHLPPTNCSETSMPADPHTNGTGSGRNLRYVDAINEALALALTADPRVFVFGLDVDDHKGIQGSTKGLPERFGADRVFGTPLSEEAMTGGRDRRGDRRAAAGPCPYPHGLPDAVHEPASQHGGQEPLHVRRRGWGAAGGARDHRQVLGPRRAAFAGTALDVHACARAEGGGRRAIPTMPKAACSRRSRTTTR